MKIPLRLVERRRLPPNGAANPEWGFGPGSAGIRRRDEAVPLGTRDRRRDLPAQRGPRAVSAAALLHPAGRDVRPPAQPWLRPAHPRLRPPLVAGYSAFVVPGSRSASLPTRTAAGRSGSATSAT